MKTGSLSVKPWFLCAFVLPDATQNQLCALGFPGPDGVFAPVVSPAAGATFV